MKKKIFAAVCAAVLAAGALTATASAEETGYLKGDADLNGVVELEDAVFVSQYWCDFKVQKAPSVTEEQFKAMDIDEDGEITPADAQYLLMNYVRQLAGFQTAWEELVKHQND